MKLKYICILGLALAGCTAKVPENATPTDQVAEIYPDYNGVTIPVNIAPLNFKILNDGADYVTEIRDRAGNRIVVGGNKIDIDLNKWHELLKTAAGDSVFIDVYVKGDSGWLRHAPLSIAVVNDSIDPYITYRLIEPSYVNFETMRISQRCLENFDENDIYNVCPFSNENNGQCINCHSAQNYNRDGHWQMHVRVTKGGTVIADGDNVKKVNLKTPETISAGVYPAWHPQLPLIVYSNNNTYQVFHSTDPNKIEVQDSASDLIIYDTESGSINFVAKDSTEWETFPAWSPKGDMLYYVSASVPALSREELAAAAKPNYRNIKYNIYRKPFDIKTRTFGTSDTVYHASAHNVSATLPRISPDGRYLLFTQAEYGTFHIWHHDADLYLMDLQTGDVRPLSAANSSDTESYHTWSSNGRWIIFSSRRDDGNYTRLYMTYFDKDGNAHKPFLLPQHDPDDNINLFKSYNIPEFIVKPVTTDRNAIIEAIDQDL